MKVHTEVIIAGNGLSAICLALTLQKQNISCVLIAKERLNSYPDPWWENIQSGFYENLKAFIPHEDLVTCLVPVEKTISAWGTSYSESSTPFHQFQLNKGRLINLLRDKIARTPIPVIPGKITATPVYEHQKWSLLLTGEDAAAYEITGKILVDATGRNSAVINKYFTQRKFTDDHIAISKFMRRDNHRHGSLFAIESVANGWWYVLTSPDWVQATLITNHASNPSNQYLKFFRHCLEISYYTRGYVQESLDETEPLVLDARTGIAWKTAYGHWVSVGEAAYSTDPLSGHGNQICLDQVAQLAGAINIALNDNSGFTHLDKQYHRDFFDHVNQRAAYYELEKRWPQSKFW